MTLLTVAGVRYEVRSGGDGPPALLVHGFTGRGADWGPLLPAFRRHARTITVDLLGHGRSDSPVHPDRHALPAQAADLAQILRRLGAVPAVIVGYSFGARLALCLVADHPDVVAALVLESPSAGLADPAERARREAADEALAARIERDGMEAFVDTWWETTPVFASERDLPPATRARLRSARLRNRPAGLAASLRGAGQGAMEPLFDRLRSIARPTLVVAGELDPVGIARARDVAARIPGARLIVLSGAGHSAHRDQPAAFRRIVTTFLQEEAPA